MNNKYNQKKKLTDERRMFVGGLFPETTSKMVRSYFEQFGNVLDVKIIGEKQKRSRGFGFVLFETKAVYNRVMSLKHTIEGREVDCNTAIHTKKSGNESGKDDSYKRKVFVRDLPLDISKEDLVKHFKSYGEILQVLLVKRKNKAFTFSFVEFVKEGARNRVLETATEQILGVVCKVEPAQPKNGGKDEKKEEFQQKRVERDNNEYRRGGYHQNQGGRYEVGNRYNSDNNHAKQSQYDDRIGNNRSNYNNEKSSKGRLNMNNKRRVHPPQNHRQQKHYPVYFDQINESDEDGFNEYYVKKSKKKPVKTKKNVMNEDNPVHHQIQVNPPSNEEFDGDDHQNGERRPQGVNLAPRQLSESSKGSYCSKTRLITKNVRNRSFYESNEDEDNLRLNKSRSRNSPDSESDNQNNSLPGIYVNSQMHSYKNGRSNPKIYSTNYSDSYNDNVEFYSVKSQQNFRTFDHNNVLRLDTGPTNDSQTNTIGNTKDEGSNSIVSGFNEESPEVLNFFEKERGHSSNLSQELKVRAMFWLKTKMKKKI